MANTTVSFHIDEDVIQSAERALDDMGLSMSAAVTVFLKKVGREHRIPFEISADPFYSENNIRYLTKVINGIENGTRPLTEHDLIGVDDERNCKQCKKTALSSFNAKMIRRSCYAVISRFCFRAP